MQVIITKDYAEMSHVAGVIVEALVRQKPDAVLGLATGSTPVGLYEYLVQAHQQHGLDFQQVTTFNLDEYLDLAKAHSQSYHTFMRENLFSHVNISPDRIHFPDEDYDAVDETAEAYDARIYRAGGIDLQVLGIGRNGHIAFDEPAEELSFYTSTVTLTPSTREANARFFSSLEEVPTRAVSSGMGTIMQAKHLLILANGEGKREAVAHLLDGHRVTTLCPATLALLHPRATLIVDEAAAGRQTYFH